MSLSTCSTLTHVPILCRSLTTSVCKVKMGKMISVLILFIVNQVIHTFGNVTVFRAPVAINRRKLICQSEDDGSALIWNANLAYELYQPFNSLDDGQPFPSTCNSDSSINCKMQPSEECWILWNSYFWNFEQSITTPMGLVFDQRWEGFEEYEYSDSDYYPITLNTQEDQTTVLPFSVRVERDLHIVLCKSKNIFKNFCYWVIIGGWGNVKSIIRKCPSGLPEIGNYPKNTSVCYEEQTSKIHSPLSMLEWRSFIVTWNAKTKNITVYDDKDLLMTYEDTEVYSTVTKSYFAFIRSPEKMLARYHDYSYFRTINERQALTSPEFKVSSNEVCLQMIIGLCVVCNANVALVDSQENVVLQTVTVKGSKVAAVHGLPMWQSVKIHANVSPNKVLKVQLYPKLALSTSNPLWAIADVRQCPPDGCFREGKLYFNQDYVRSKNYFWTNATCQKLFYTEQTVVNATSIMNPNIEIVDADCPEGYIGPNCSISCSSRLESNSYCWKISICYKNGCTCAPGLLLDDCSTDCPFKTYGHNCKRRCGNCVKGKCNKRTGQCNDGCEKSEKIYIPPMCTRGIEIPNESMKVTQNETNIVAEIPITWKDEYKDVSLQYYYKIKLPNGVIKNQNPMIIYPDTKVLQVNFKSLTPGVVYNITCVFLVEGDETSRPWLSVRTTCESIKNFDIQANETSITIDSNLDILKYPCSVNIYNIIIDKTDNVNNRIYNQFTLNFPYEIRFLQSYTWFNVTVINANGYKFFQQIRTLAGVPSEVLNLHVTLQSNTQCTLNWSPPENPNGEIKNYTIIVKVNKYLGCPDNKVLTEEENRPIVKSTNETFIIISELHPYTSYGVEIRVYNSRHRSEKVKQMFSTDANVIPTSKVSKLNIQNGRLSWDSPEDCTTISGGTDKTNITITGISDAVSNYFITKQTKLKYLDIEPLKLPSAEEYVVKAYVLRDFNREVNDTVYAEKKFKTPPSSPPVVDELEIVEIDNRNDIYPKIQLRWHRPKPPLNGELQYYKVTWCANKQCTSYKSERVELNETCDLWNDYVCRTFDDISRTTIKVEAFNVNVMKPSIATVSRQTIYNKSPGPPSNYTFTMHNSSAVILKWHHPWITVAHLQYFRIWIMMNQSDLKDVMEFNKTSEDIYMVDDYMPSYYKLINLLPATRYFISVESVTISNLSASSDPLEIRTKSTIKLNGELNVTTDVSDSTIKLKLPCVEHDTHGSIMYIVVKGPFPCKEYAKLPPHLEKLAGVKMYDIAWVAAVAPAHKLACNVFTIGKNENANSNSTNCPIRSGELYNIVVLVTEQISQLDTSREPIRITKNISARIGEPPPKNSTVWIVLSVILLLVIAGAAFYFYRRKQQKPCKKIILQDEMILSQNIENYEHEARFEISNSKEDLSTPSDRQSLSRATTPEVPPIAIETDDKEKEITSLVKVKDFEDYVREAIGLGLLDKQYETFPRGQTQPWDYGKLPQNKSKNRYGNLIAYDENRVILEKRPNDDYSDYINANYITGYKKKKRYIATQGPKPNTVIDFWRMIWQEKVLIICMLANVVENGKTKCEQYWPDIGKKKKYGEVIVLNAKHSVFADYCFRILHITCGEETRKVEHLHYTAWPDHGIPLYTHSVVTYLKKLLATPPGNGPVVVHCSAGVGRTGTIVLCDICLHRAAAEGVVDVFAETASIRRERANMVDNKQQYLLAHLALVECLLSIPTTLPCNDTLPIRIKDMKKQLPVQLQRLQSIAWQDEALRQVTSPPTLSERNRAKNRFPELISDKVSRIYLKRYPASDEDSDYLSAVYVDGVKLQNQYLATQLPMPSTINDFWRTIAEFKVELILMLQPPDLMDPTCCAIASESGEFKPTPYLNITTKEFVEMEHYTSQKLLLIDNSEKPAREQFVTILCLTEWKPGRNQPPPQVMTMVTFWQATERIARGDGPTVTLCHDGVTGCGLYLALSFLLERMSVERECDVCLAVRAIRRSRPDFVQSLEHLEYLYDAAVTYLQYFETYANFS